LVLGRDLRVDDLNLQAWSAWIGNCVDLVGATHEIMRVLEVAANGHLSTAVTVGHRPLAPIKRVGGPRSHVAAVCLAGRIIVDGSRLAAMAV
jgi:hypothetical protein